MRSQTKHMRASEPLRRQISSLVSIGFALALNCACCSPAVAQPATNPTSQTSKFLALVTQRNENRMAPPQDEGLLPNIKSPTLGGKQFWTDFTWRQGWRLQQNSLTKHWRIIDPSNLRHAWGSRQACERKLLELVPDNRIQEKKIVILLHGLMRSANSMNGLQTALNAEKSFATAAFEYASTRAAISDHASALASVIAGLPNDLEIAFVGHSMGNIVVRHYIGDLQQAGDEQTLSRIRQVVMLGPPNQGSSIARQLSKTGVFGWIVGTGGMQLGPEWDTFSSHLATPHCPFGIVAGQLPEENFQNPIVDGAGDFVVSVEETKLEGAKDFLVVPRLHSFLMDDAQVQQSVISFLDSEHF